MKIKNVTLGILALTTGMLNADLFDSVEQLDGKYGAPILTQQKSGKEARTYKSGDYVVEAHVAQNISADELGADRCVYERHTRVDGKALTSAEINIILTRRPERGEWRYVGNDKWALLQIGKAGYISSSRALVQHRKL
jgi:hypothetical protein